MNFKIKQFSSKSIRFRMTLIYSAILFVFSSLIVLLLNFYLNLYLSTELPPPPEGHFPLPETNNEISSEEYQNYEKEIKRIENDRIKEARRDDLENFLNISIFSLFPLAFVSFFVGYYISGHFLSPLNKLNEKIKKLKVEGLGNKIDQTTDDEIGNLINSFNEMSDRLDKAFKVQKEFVQDAAHELKTPLTVITINLDTILEDKTATKEELKKAIKNALNGIEKINNLTESLLNLTLPSSQNRKNININNLVKEQVISLKDLARTKKVKLIFKNPKEIIKMKADQINLGRAIFNLIENAIKYSSFSKKSDFTPEVLISLDKNDSEITIKVKDNGPGIPIKHQARIFDRFYRIDKSRNRKKGGFGLGLSIVKKIIKEHDGKIKLTSNNKETLFKIRLPL